MMSHKQDGGDLWGLVTWKKLFWDPWKEKSDYEIAFVTGKD